MKIDLINLKPDYMSILIGVNDVWHEINRENGVAAENVEKIYDMLISEVLEALPNIKIMILEPYVVKGTATEENLETFRTEVAKRAAAAKRIAEANIKKADYEAEMGAQIARAKMESEKQKADVIVKAEIEKEQIVIAAEAEAEKKRREARGEADAIFAKLEAEAKGNYEILKAKGEGFQQIVNACGSDADAAAKMLMIEKLD
jgi:hypothetical protein